jgi:hypothetical protein
VSTAATVEARLALLEHERTLLRLLSSYGHFLDYGPEDAFVDLWTATAELTYDFGTARAHGGTARADLAFRGREEIAEFWRGHTHAPEVMHKHLVAEPLIEVAGDRATIDSYYVKLDESPAGPRLTSFGRYLDLAERCADGAWRFARRNHQCEVRAI